MTKHDVLEMILNEEMDSSVRNTLVHFMFDEVTTGSARKVNGIPKLKNCPGKLECDDVFRRMKMVAGDTGVGVAKILGVTPQAFNNQIKRNALSGKPNSGNIRRWISVLMYSRAWQNSTGLKWSIQNAIQLPGITLWGLAACRQRSGS